MKKKYKIFMVSSVPSTLWAFYKKLLEHLQDSEFELTASGSPGEGLYDIKNQIQCNFFPVPMTRQISPLKDIMAIFKLYRHFRSERYDIIHAHTPKAALVALIAGFLAKVPNRVYTIHGPIAEIEAGLKRFILKNSEKLMCKLATTILVVSKNLREKVANENICALDRLQILGNGTACGIDFKKFNVNKKDESIIRQIRNYHNIPYDAIVVGFIGRIVPAKGIQCLIDAFDIVQKKLDNIYMMLIGMYDNVRQTISSDLKERIETNDKIIKIGHKSDIVPYYYAMDMLVLPSHREGFNYVLLEAAAMGLCTITTNISGCIDGVIDGQTGFIIEVDDYEQLADRIIRFANNPQMREEFGRNGCRRVKKYFNSDRLVAEHMSLYNSLI